MVCKPSRSFACGLSVEGMYCIVNSFGFSLFLYNSEYWEWYFQKGIVIFHIMVQLKSLWAIEQA